MKHFKSNIKQVSLGDTVRENLPYKVVHYPGLYGTFIGFSNKRDELPYLCNCTVSAIESYVRLGQSSSHKKLFAYSRSGVFPDVLSNYLASSAHRRIKSLKFREKICHRCQMSVPSLSYCHKMYGTEFVQTFGWYINQAYLRFGVDRYHFEFLNDLCPQELQDYITNYRRILYQYKIEQQRLQKIVQGPNRTDITDDEITFWSNVKHDEAKDFIRLQREERTAQRKITKYVENTVRDEFGIKKVGEGWVSEIILSQIVQKIFHKQTITTHYRPLWLNKLELDIYIEELRIGFEYQGQQHFFPIKAWGGPEALKKVKERDLLKVKLCKENGVRLIHINYYDPLTEKYVRECCVQRGRLARKQDAGDI